MPAQGQVFAVAPGPARGIEHDRGRQRIEQHAHRGMLDREQAQRPVVGFRPQRIALGRVVLGREGCSQLRLMVEAPQQITDLAHPGGPGLGIVAEREPQQRQPLDPEQQLAKRRLRAHVTSPGP
jgi:hypothetical protein